jgi:hypothetical protein
MKSIFFYLSSGFKEIRENFNMTGNYIVTDVAKAFLGNVSVNTFPR